MAFETPAFICPQTRLPLHKATSMELTALRNSRDYESLESAWIRSDSAVAYPVQNGIPLLIPSAAIPMSEAKLSSR